MMPSLKMSSPWIYQKDIWELIAMLWEGVWNAVSPKFVRKMTSDWSKRRERVLK